jgi:hypothetical protein
MENSDGGTGGSSKSAPAFDACDEFRRMHTKPEPQQRITTTAPNHDMYVKVT